ncbi:MAG: RNA 2',3'-cyclic phosphodiesterase [Deltaproteobacteria bacterium]|nr:RNA 2',3'-cyclic phosphodiesterase [Deltaproteobacteria bacterium]
MLNKIEEIRSFIAIEVPQEAKAFLEKVSTELKRTRADVKWVRPEGIHLTLKFLGQVRMDLIAVLERELAPVFAEFTPFEIQIAGLGAFPGLGRPRVVWAGLTEPFGALPLMAGRLDEKLERFGFSREKRPFSPHLTLGRVRSNSGLAAMVETVRQQMDIQGPKFTADHAILFQSILKPSGAEYRALCRFYFSR